LLYGKIKIFVEIVSEQGWMSRRMSSQGGSRPPSEAFMESMRLASESMKSDHFIPEKTSNIGWKTYTASIALFLIGLILFITGYVFTFIH